LSFILEDILMRKNRWVFGVCLLVFAILACNAVTGGSKTSPQAGAGQSIGTQAASVQASLEPLPATETGIFNTEFPLPTDISNFMDIGSDAINFQAKMSLKDAIAFYRDSFAKIGYKERELNTAITDATFNLVFDGHASGKAIVVQGVDLGDGSVNISIRFEDM
jgi:hypothetical protein